MWHSIPEYLMFVMVVAVILHGIDKRYLVSTFSGAAACSLMNVVYQAVNVTRGQVDIEWMLPMFLVGMALSIPLCATVGLPFVVARHLLKRAHGLG